MEIKHVFFISNIIGFSGYMAVKYGIYAGYAITFPMYIAATVSGIIGFLLLLRMEEKAIDEKFLNEMMTYKPRTVQEEIDLMKSKGEPEEHIKNFLNYSNVIKDGYVISDKPVKDVIDASKIIGIVGVTLYVSLLPQFCIAALDRLTYIF